MRVVSAADLLRAAGLRRTPARIAVLAKIDAVRRPVSHGELSDFPDLAQVDEITLYRTLATRMKSGLVHAVMGVDGAWRYCSQPSNGAGRPGNHAHFLCTSCRSMTCLNGQPMPRAEVLPGAKVRGRHFLLYGQCAVCLARSEARPPSRESA